MSEYSTQLGLSNYGLSEDDIRLIDDFYIESQTESFYFFPLSEKDFKAYMGFNDANNTNILALWENGESDFAGVFYKGPLKGSVAVIFHDEPVWAPAFVNMGDFLQYVKTQSEDDIQDIHSRKEPLILPLSPKERTNEITKALAKWEVKTHNDDDYYINFMQICALLDYDTIGLLVPYLSIHDFYIIESICNTLSLFEYTKAYDEVKKLCDNEETHFQAKAAAKKTLEKFDAILK